MGKLERGGEGEREGGGRERVGGGEEGFRVGSIDLIVIWETNLALRHVVGLLAAASPRLCVHLQKSHSLRFQLHRN